MIGNGAKTEQNIIITSLGKECQCLTRFNVTIQVFSRPDGSGVDSKWKGGEIQETRQTFHQHHKCGEGRL